MSMVRITGPKDFNSGVAHTAERCTARTYSEIEVATLKTVPGSYKLAAFTCLFEDCDHAFIAPAANKGYCSKACSTAAAQRAKFGTRPEATVCESGEIYPEAQEKGFIAWKPWPSTQVILDNVQAILVMYSAQLPLTVRQIAYILCGRFGMAKTEAQFARIYQYLNLARRAGLIDFEDIRDDGTVIDAAGGWNSPGDFWDSVHLMAEYYQHHLRRNQPVYSELWLEAAGMVPQGGMVSRQYGISTYSASGFNSLSDKWATVNRIADVLNGDPDNGIAPRPVVMLHGGDLDPSGRSIFDSFAADIDAFLNGREARGEDKGKVGLSPGNHVTWVRVMVTPSQVVESRATCSACLAGEPFTDNAGRNVARHTCLQGTPEKKDAAGRRKDKRATEILECVQAEAIPPDELAELFHDACRSVTTATILAETKALGERERAQILSDLAGPAEARRLADIVAARRLRDFLRNRARWDRGSRG
jgi:hypothetical protein